MWILIGAVATASLLGSMHCVGMCGPLALWASGSAESVSRGQQVLATGLYHFGRLLTYAIAGAIAGAFGGLLDVGGDLIGVQLVAARIVGLLMITLGGWQLWHLYAKPVPRVPTANARPPLVTRMLLRLRPLVFRLPVTSRGLMTGLLTALLPCGWLYLFALVAAGTGNWLAGTVVMAAFWVGTVPALLSLVVGTQSLASRFRKFVPAAVALMLITGGCYTASGRGFAQLNSLSDLEAASRFVVDATRANDAHAKPAPSERSSSTDGVRSGESPNVAQAISALIEAPLPCCVDHDNTVDDNADHNKTGGRVLDCRPCTGSSSRVAVLRQQSNGQPGEIPASSGPQESGSSFKPQPPAAEQPSVDSSPASKPERILLPCVHCGEPTPCSRDRIPEKVFCCAGCHGAYSLIHGWGLGDFYCAPRPHQSPGAARPAGQSDRFEQFDSDDYLGPSTPIQHRDGTCSTELAVHGLHCGACAWLIENAILRKSGVLSSRVKMSEHTLQLVYDPKCVQLSQLAQLLDRLGYQLAPYDASGKEHIQTENRRLLIQIAIAGFLAANAMWIAVALYAGEFSGVAVEHEYFLALVGTVLGLVSVLGPGRTFFTGALAALRTRTPHMDLPVALGLAVGAAVGTWNAVRGSGHVYFDSLSTLVFLLLIGRWIQFRQQRKAAQAVDLMLRITPQHATLLRESGPTSVLVDTLMPGDLIQVAAGESLAADGKIVAGESSMDRSLLTGESVPVSVTQGSEVFAGLVNLTSPVQVQVSAVGRQSRIGQVMQSVEAASAEKTPIVLLADRVGGYFVVTVMILATLTFAFWLRASDLATATSHATALLIVACPCALALATPLAIAVGLGRAARAGILVRDGGALQQLSTPGKVWFDKTGTLTEGRQRVTRVVGSLEGLQFAAAIESECAHPVAQAIVREANQRDLPFSAIAKLETLLPGGVLGSTKQRTILVGNLKLMEARGVSASPELRSAAEQCIADGESPIFVVLDGHVTTLLGLADPLRDNAQPVIDGLRQKGWQIGILSGDHPAIVQQVGTRLGLVSENCLGGLTPEQKLAIIRTSRKEYKQVAMIGDGANDAAALAAADVGIAVRGGAEVSLQAAPVFVATGKLTTLLQLFQGSVQTTRIIYLTFAVSLAYNIIAVALAMAGWISPLVAALLMPLSSVSVIALTLASKSFGEPAQ